MAKELIRILVYVLVVVLHLGNLVYIGRSTREENIKPETLEKIRQFQGMRYRFFTTWTFCIQMVYAFLAIGYDYVSWKNSNKKDYKHPQIVTDFMNILFSGLLWPSTCLVSSLFWSVFLYDRSLIFPKHLDDIIPPLSNHIMHSAIVPIVFLELVLRPRTEPENHAKNVMQLTMHMSVYFSVMYFTFIERGIWLYPMFSKIYGTIYFPLTIVFIAIACYFYYYIQWPIVKMIHGSKAKVSIKEKIEKKVQSKKNR